MNKYCKILIWILTALVAVFVLASAILPTWLSSNSGRTTALQWINKSIKGKLTIEKMKLSWFGNQQFENVRLENEKGTVLFNSPLVETDTSLLYLLWGGRTFNRTVLQSPYMVLPESKGESHGIPKFKSTLLIDNGTFVFASENNAPAVISNLNVKQTSDGKNLEIKASTTQGSITGFVQVEAILAPQIKAKVHVQNFPTSLIDNFFQDTLPTLAIGPYINLDLDLESDEGQSLLIHGSVHSANLDASVDGVTQNGKFILNPSTHLDFTVTPLLFKQLIDQEHRGEWELASKADLTIRFEKGEFPITKGTRFYQPLALEATAHLDRMELHHANFGGYSLNQFDISVMSAGNLQLAFQGEIQGKESTVLTGNLSLSPKGALQFDYTCNGFPVTLLELVSAQLEEKIRLLLGGKFDAQGTGSFISKRLDTKLQLSSPQSQVLGHIEGNLSELNFDLKGAYHVKGEKAKVIGKTIDYALTGIGKFHGKCLSIPYITGKVFNQHFDFDVRGQIGEEKKNLSLDQIQLIALGTIKELPIGEDLPLPVLEKGSVYIQVDGSKNLITGNIDSSAAQANIEIHRFIQNDTLSFKDADILFTCNLNDFPVNAISPFIADELDLGLFIGNTLTLSSSGSYTPQAQPRLSLDLNAQGSGFATKLSVSLDSALVVKQNSPSYIYWELTPQRYIALGHYFDIQSEHSPTFILTKPTQIALNITQFTCPTTPLQGFSDFLCQSGFVGNLEIGTTTFRNEQTDETLAFKQITGSIQGENFSEAIDVSLTGSVSASTIPKEKSEFSFTGQMLNFWTKSCKFNRSGLSVKGELNLNLIPVKQILGLVPLDHETRVVAQAILGQFINAKIHGEISQLAGPLTIDIKSSNFKAVLPLQLQGNALYLRDYVDAEISLTDAINETFLKDINPLLITGAYSNHPLKLYIDPKGFVLPIKHYSLEKVQIGKAILDLGKIQVRNGGQIETLMEFLHTSEVTPEGMMEAWFTPIFINLQNGVASYKRFDALIAGNVHIAMWGGVNLINQKVKMTLAIAPTTLYQRFNISGLTRKDMFQVKMRGTTDHLKLDWSAAKTRIAFIIARNAGGHIGSIVGGLIEQLVSSMGDEPVPPSTTDPLPWESQYPSEPGESIPQEAPNTKRKGA